VTSEIASTARPTALRVAGFVCVALGAVLAGVGATREWVAVGFSADTEHAADLSVHGIDVWEGKVVLFAAAAALLVLLAMRISGSPGTRRGLAVVLIVLGALCIALPVVDAIQANNRFANDAGIERYVRFLAVRSSLPEDDVREQLAEQFSRDLRVELSAGLWITVAGGVLLVAGGALSVAWSGRGSPEPVPDEGA
jgi:hypothetical protein